MQYVSTRDQDRIFTSEDVLNLGLAPDGGLFVPKEFPSFTNQEITNLKNKDFKIIETSWNYGMNKTKKSSEIVVIG